MWKLKFTSQLKRRPGTGPRPVEIRFFFPCFFAAPFWQAEHLIWHIAAHILAPRRRQQSAQVQPQWRQRHFVVQYIHFLQPAKGDKTEAKKCDAIYGDGKPSNICTNILHSFHIRRICLKS